MKLSVGKDSILRAVKSKEGEKDVERAEIEMVGEIAEVNEKAGEREELPFYLL